MTDEGPYWLHGPKGPYVAEDWVDRGGTTQTRALSIEQSLLWAHRQSRLPRPWGYRAKLDRVVDGDTIDLQVDLGFRMRHFMRARVLGVDTPEPRGETRPAGDAASNYVRNWMQAAAAINTAWPLLIHTIKTDSFGRWLTDIYDLRGNSLSEDLIADGHGVPLVS